MSTDGRNSVNHITGASPSNAEAARLWHRFLAGSNPHGSAAFDRLYETFRPVLLRFCRVLLRDSHLAEDATDTVFVRLLESRPAIKSSFTALLYRTARNVCATERSKYPLVDERRQPTNADPEVGGQDEDALDALTECLERLCDADRTVVILHDAQGLSFREIREIREATGLRAVLSTLSRRLKQIRTALRRCLKEKNIFYAQNPREPGLT